MKLTPTLKRGLLAVALAAAATTAARATTVPQYATGDLLLGFYETGFAKDYIVDLGPVSTLTASSFTLLNTNTQLAADLVTAFGANWATNGLLYWGLTASNTVSKEIWASNPNAGTAWLGATAQGQGANDVLTIGGDYSGQVQANNEKYAKGLIQTGANTDTSSWESIAGTAGGSGPSLETFSGNGGDGGINDVVTNSLEFDDVKAKQNVAGTKLGTFALNSSGDLSFTSTAVPEPSTLAAIGMGALVLTLAGRRRGTTI